MTASAWRTSAGTAARIRVARCTNLVRTLKDYAAKGLMIAGLDADGTTDTDSFELATSPLVIVVGSEGRGLARLTLTVCDVTVSIPMARAVESLERLRGGRRGARRGGPPPPGGSCRLRQPADGSPSSGRRRQDRLRRESLLRACDHQAVVLVLAAGRNHADRGVACASMLRAIINFSMT